MAKLTKEQMKEKLEKFEDQAKDIDARLYKKEQQWKKLKEQINEIEGEKITYNFEDVLA